MFKTTEAPEEHKSWVRVKMPNFRLELCRAATWFCLGPLAVLRGLKFLMVGTLQKMHSERDNGMEGGPADHPKRTPALQPSSLEAWAA